MSNIFILYETFLSGHSDILIIFFSLFCISSGISVIISKNPIVSVLFLISLFLSVAMYLMTSGISFIGLAYLLVYVGAVSILFLFILMLINVRVSELITDNNNSIPLSLIIITIFGITFQGQANSPSYIVDPFDVSNNIRKYDVLYASAEAWDSALSEVSHITNIGNILYTSYPILLLTTSLILLLAMVGSIIITIKQ